MSTHPENSPEVNEILKTVGASETVEVWCKCCEAFTRMNASYAKVIKTGEIECCATCRGNGCCEAKGCK